MFASNLGFRSSSSDVGPFGNNAFWNSVFNLNRSLVISQNTQTQTDWDNLIDITNPNGFTIEYWMYTTSFAPGNPNISNHTINPGPGAQNGLIGNNYWSFAPIIGGKLQFFVATTLAVPDQRIETATNVIALNQWYNISCVCTTTSGTTTITLYIDGVRQQIGLYGSGSLANSYSFTTTTIRTPVNMFSMGEYGNRVILPDNSLRGYTDELRVSNINRYSGASYTVATAPFVSDANTQLLIDMNGFNGSTTFIDKSSVGWTVNNPSNLVVISNSRADHT